MTDRSPLYPDEVLSGRRQAPGGDGPVKRTGSGVAMVLDSWRRRPVPRRVIGTLSVLMLVAGVALFAWPFATNLWSDWKQARLADGFGSPEHRRAYITRTIEPGDALTRIAIPRLGVDAIVVQGTTLSALQAGAGHYEHSALPCEKGNAAIAGHRTTYGKPFADVDELEAGDRIILETPVGRCTYEVKGSPWITAPTDFGVVARKKGSLLTLTTCHPPGSAAERLIVRAELVKSELRAA
ncbi:MAG: sortase [Actinomycetota bacterium]